MNDEFYMEKVLNLAANVNPSPNPRVGCVIVNNNKIVGTGLHKKYGEDHAEVIALKKAGSKTKGAVLYINLEPCCHFGKTPPCTEIIVKSGIKKVVLAMKDPNKLVNGKGIKHLRKKGVNVRLKILEEKAKRLNEAYIKYITSKKPFVILKTAMTLDGKIATVTGDSKWITGKEARVYVHKLRNEVDAVLVGTNTVLEDNPRLTSRIKKGKDPKRIIIDTKLKIPLNYNVFKDSNVILITTSSALETNMRKIRVLKKNNIKVLIVGKKKISLKRLVKELGKLGIISLMIEGGSKINASAIKEKIVDKVIFFIAPKILGGEKALSPITGDGIKKVKKAISIRKISIKRFNEDFLIEGYVHTNQ